MTSFLPLQALAWITSFPFSGRPRSCQVCFSTLPPRKHGLCVQFGKCCWKSICGSNLYGGAFTSSNMLSNTRVHLLTLAVIPLWPKWALAEVIPEGLATIFKWGIPLWKLCGPLAVLRGILEVGSACRQLTVHAVICPGRHNARTASRGCWLLFTLKEVHEFSKKFMIRMLKMSSRKKEKRNRENLRSRELICIKEKQDLWFFISPC